MNTNLESKMNQSTYEKKLNAETEKAKASLKARGIINPTYVQLEEEQFKSASFIKLISTKTVIAGK